MKTKPLTCLLSLPFLFLFSCAANLNSTTVSSIAIAPVELGSSVHILLPDAMIESKKVREYLRNELMKLGFSKGEYDNSKIILTFFARQFYDSGLSVSIFCTKSTGNHIGFTNA